MSYDHNNVFAKIIREEIPSKKVFEDDETLAFHDIAQAAPVHIIVIPKGSFQSFDDFATAAAPERISRFFKTVQQVAKLVGVDKDGYRLITNHGRNASQSVPHFHVHILGGRPLGGLVPGDSEQR